MIYIHQQVYINLFWVIIPWQKLKKQVYPHAVVPVFANPPGDHHGIASPSQQIHETSLGYSRMLWQYLLQFLCVGYTVANVKDYLERVLRSLPLQWKIVCYFCSCHWL